MKAKQSKRLVIDASVARACGDSQATYPTSVHCRNFLESVLNIRRFKNEVQHPDQDCLSAMWAL
jgi:hypothetical protein